MISKQTCVPTIIVGKMTKETCLRSETSVFKKAERSGGSPVMLPVRTRLIISKPEFTASDVTMDLTVKLAIRTHLALFQGKL